MVLLPEQPTRGRPTGHNRAAPLLAAHRRPAGGLRQVPRAVRVPAAECALRAARAGDERHVSAVHPNAAAADVPGPEAAGARLPRGAAIRIVLADDSHSDRADSAGPAARHR